MLKLEALKLEADKIDVLLNGTLDELIKAQTISSEMATSLANDSDIVAEIAVKLIETAELLYFNSDTITGLMEEEQSKIENLIS